MIYFNKLIEICINRYERKVVDNYDVRSIENKGVYQFTIFYILSISVILA